MNHGGWTKQELADLAGCDVSYIRRLCREGKLNETKKGRVADDDVAKGFLAKRKTKGTSAHSQWLREKTAGEKYMTKLRKLRYQREHGRIEREITAGLQAVVVIARDRFRGLPSKLAAEFGGPQAARLERRWRVEIDQILWDMSGAKEPFDPDAGFVPTPPMVGAPESITYTAQGEAVELTLGHENEWLSSVRNGWVVVREFYDQEGNKVGSPDPTQDVGWFELTSLRGNRIRKWIGPSHASHPREIFENGEWHTTAKGASHGIQ